MEVKFINKSPALGCLVVIQSDDGSVIKFKLLFWNGLEPTLTSEIIVPSSTYTIYVYDLEKNGRINEMPSHLAENSIHVTQKDGHPNEMGKYNSTLNFRYIILL